MEKYFKKIDKKYEYENIILDEKEFFERFNNFRLLFTVENPNYLTQIRQNFSQTHSDLFDEINIKFKNINIKILDDLDANFKSLLYKAYLVLREKGFSNKEIGLKYW